MALIEARPYRPFKSSEEYLEAMKEDLAEWLSTLYPELLINAENFMDRLDTGVALCKHANNVRQAAEDYLARRQARNKSMTRSMTSGLAGPILAMGNVHYLPAAKSGTFFSRDNVSNFITWCRKSLKIIECLLFETDDLIMRKNEKHVILCLLEVARRGAKFGMLAPMLVQMERQIDREIAADNKANGIGCGTQTDTNSKQTSEIGVGTDAATDTGDIFDTDSENGDDSDDSPMLVYGPQPQIITNDLKSLDEMVRDLVEKCTCPSQFPMVRVSEGKYRIGDTKVLIFVRILRSHVMVRVGGGWDTLSHYLDKHDPCRCRAQHRTAVAARLIPPRTSNQSNGIELHKAQVIFERSPPSTRKLISTFNNQINQASAVSQQSSTTASPMSSTNTTPTHAAVGLTTSSNNRLSPSYGSNNTHHRNGSRSPTPQRKYLNQYTVNNTAITTNDQQSSNLARRSISPSPRRLVDIKRKQSALEGVKSAPVAENHVQFDSLNLSQTEGSGGNHSSANTAHNGTNEANVAGNKFENISDNGSEISDEGYRSLGVIQSNAQKRESIHSQASTEDAENPVRLDQNSSDSQLSPVENAPIDTDFTDATVNLSGPQSLPATLSIATSPASPVPAPTPNTTPIEEDSNTFERNGVFITDDEITVDIANSTGLRKTDFSAKIFGGEEPATEASKKESKIPRSPLTQRRRSVDSVGSLQDLSTRTGLPVFNRTKPVYRSVRKPSPALQKESSPQSNASSTKRKPKPQEVTNTWSGRATGAARKRPTINGNTFERPTSTPTNSNTSAFERNSKVRSSQIVYDSNGRRVRSGYAPASLNTSPTKQATTASPLAQQLLEAASSAKNDAQILEKMKALLSRYASRDQKTTGKKPVYEDFTSAWVHSNGNLERSSSCSPPTKTLSKKSSAASSTESTHSRDLSVIVSPRRDRTGLSKIPTPVRQNTELY